MTVAYVGLGANLGDPVQQVKSGLQSLESIPDTGVTARSSLYRTAPVGPQDQPDFINAVARLETGLPAITLLRRLQDIEDGHGRRRGSQRWGPRTLDLDLLLFGEQEINDETLRVPHPEMTRRGFVLLPLLEIEPDIHIPGHGPAADRLREIGEQGVERLQD